MKKRQARIVFLDDNEDLRESVAVLFQSSLGVECSCFGSLMELERHSDEVLNARVAILDINLGPNAPDGVDAFNWLIDHGFSGNILFFTGHARSNPQVVLAEEKGVEILEKPISPDKLISSVRRYLDHTP
jgi:FixJ family two-component response regulator